MAFSVGELLDVLEKSKVERVDKPWGYEVIISNPDFTIKFIHVRHGHRTSRQIHSEKDELAIMLDGGGTTSMRTYHDDHVRPAQPLRIPPGTEHRTIGPLHLIEVCTSNMDHDITRLEDDYGSRR